MDVFFANNWFSILTVLVMVGGFLVNLGVQRQRQAQSNTDVKDIKETMQRDREHVETTFKKHLDGLMEKVTANERIMSSHINNSDAHVTSTLLELLKTRHEFTAQQLLDARNDIQRIEQMLARQN